MIEQEHSLNLTMDYKQTSPPQTTTQQQQQQSNNSNNISNNCKMTMMEEEEFKNVNNSVNNITLSEMTSFDSEESISDNSGELSLSASIEFYDNGSNPLKQTNNISIIPANETGLQPQHSQSSPSSKVPLLSFLTRSNSNNEQNTTSTTLESPRNSKSNNNTPRSSTTPPPSKSSPSSSRKNKDKEKDKSTGSSSSNTSPMSITRPLKKTGKKDKDKNKQTIVVNVDDNTTAVGSGDSNKSSSSSSSLSCDIVNDTTTTNNNLCSVVEEQQNTSIPTSSLPSSNQQQIVDEESSNKIPSPSLKSTSKEVPTYNNGDIESSSSSNDVNNNTIINHQLNCTDDNNNNKLTTPRLETLQEESSNEQKSVSLPTSLSTSPSPSFISSDSFFNNNTNGTPTPTTQPPNKKKFFSFFRTKQKPTTLIIPEQKQPKLQPTQTISSHLTYTPPLLPNTNTPNMKSTSNHDMIKSPSIDSIVYNHHYHTNTTHNHNHHNNNNNNLPQIKLINQNLSNTQFTRSNSMDSLRPMSFSISSNNPSSISNTNGSSSSLYAPQPSSSQNNTSQLPNGMIHSPIGSPMISPALRTSIVNHKFQRKSSLSNFSTPTSLLQHRSFGGSMSLANEATWIVIASNWEEWSEPHFRSTLTKYVYQGIPDKLRPTIWYHLSNMIPQLTSIPTCTNLTLIHNLDKIVNYMPTLTPLSTPSTATPISTPSFKSQSSPSVPTVSISNGGGGSNSNLMSQSHSTILQSPPQNSSTNNNNNNQIPVSPTSLNNRSPLFQSTKPHKCFYQSIVKHSSEHEEQIKVDIQRSFTDLPDSLREPYSAALSNVLKAISLYDPELGYCQGISFVGSILITRLSEEEVFHILLRLLEGVMRDFYIVGMRGLKLRLYQLGRFVKELFPKLHNHLIAIDLDLMIFASPWFLTAFSYHLTEECSIRIIDAILLQGIEAFFSIGLAIFQIIETDLLNCTDSSQAMEYFRCNAKTTIDVNTLMDTASRITISPNQLSLFMQQFEAETKPSIPTEFNPDIQPKEKKKDPNWVVKKYKLKERICNLEDDLAVTKQELHYTRDKNEEEKFELVKHLQELSDHESVIIEQKRQIEILYQNLLLENEALKKKYLAEVEMNKFVTLETNKLRSQLEAELWKNNPKKSIQFIK
eukprot:gene894-1118_t